MQRPLQLTLAVLIAGAAFSASAQTFGRTDTTDFDDRQARQEARIERGFARGELTRFELRELRREQRQIARAEAAAKADGFVTRGEARHLDFLLDQADQRIRQMRHDRDDRRGGY